jgi:hypothetical protein
MLDLILRQKVDLHLLIATFHMLVYFAFLNSALIILLQTRITTNIIKVPNRLLSRSQMHCIIFAENPPIAILTGHINQFENQPSHPDHDNHGNVVIAGIV